MFSKRWFENCGGTNFQYPHFTSSLSLLPQFYLFFTFLASSILPLFNLCLIGHFEPRFGNHGVQTLGAYCVPFSTLCLDNFRLIFYQDRASEEMSRHSEIELRCPAAILSISCDTCSDIAKHKAVRASLKEVVGKNMSGAGFCLSKPGVILIEWPTRP